MDSRLHIFGIRHHGPGSAASLIQALDAVRPEIVLIEGPPEASDILAMAAAPGMRPPVAILTFPAKAPEDAHFHPFAEFSPEWQAMLWAVRNETPARFLDEPITARRTIEASESITVDPDDEDDPDQDTAQGDADQDEDEHHDREEGTLLRDPLAHLAAAAGHSDGEAWWGSLIEEHVRAPDVFSAIETAMTALREARDEEVEAPTEALLREERREAHMRLGIRKALKEFEGPIAMVCGAWHVPALRRKIAISKDRETVRGTKALKAACCWVPWTDTRLAFASGYGAGVVSPAWYRHLWKQVDSSRDLLKAVAGWQTRAARLLRREGIGASTAGVIEATRLATALAAVRGLPVPGLHEMRDATRSALCHGEEGPLHVIEQHLIIGNRVGEVDESAPQPPLLADLTRLQKSLRLKPEAEERDIALDLRSKAGLAKSVLLHRLLLLDVPWGQLLDAQAGRGTFREIWKLEWRPELSVALAEAVIHGPTIEQASATAALARGDEERDCDALAELVRNCLLADLPKAATANIVRLQAAAVTASSVFGLARAVAPLVDILRYGTARALPEAALRRLVLSLLAEVCAGLRYACRGLDEASASEARDALAALDRAIALLEAEASDQQWRWALREVVDDEHGTPLLCGFATRLLTDCGELEGEETEQLLGRALSASVRPADAGQWFEGFINESGEILLIDDALFGLVDEWICRQEEETFIELLPMLRRALSRFDQSAARRILERVRGGAVSGAVMELEDPRAAQAFEQALPLLKTILGVERE